MLSVSPGIRFLALRLKCGWRMIASFSISASSSTSELSELWFSPVRPKISRISFAQRFDGVAFLFKAGRVLHFAFQLSLEIVLVHSPRPRPTLPVRRVRPLAAAGSALPRGLPRVRDGQVPNRRQLSAIRPVRIHLRIRASNESSCASMVCSAATGCIAVQSAGHAGRRAVLWRVLIFVEQAIIVVFVGIVLRVGLCGGPVLRSPVPATCPHRRSRRPTRMSSDAAGLSSAMSLASNATISASSACPGRLFRHVLCHQSWQGYLQTPAVRGRRCRAGLASGAVRGAASSTASDLAKQPRGCAPACR